MVTKDNSKEQNQVGSSRHEAGVKSSQGGSGNPDKASPAAVERYLKGVSFPASKDTLMEKAKQNNAPSDVISVLNRFDAHEYKSVVEVAKEVGRVE